MNPYVLIATHQRLSITKKNIASILSCNVGVILVVSEIGEYDLFKQFFQSITIVNHPNLPLGKKWQCGVEVAMELNADPLIVNGSDDILAPEFFVKVKSLLQDGYHFVGLNSWYVYDMRVAYRFQYLAKLPLGGGRVYSKKLLEKINYSLFDITRDKHLDDLSYGNVLNAKMDNIILSDPLILSVKGDWQMLNPMHKFFASANVRLVETINNPKILLEHFNYVRD